MSTVRVFSAAFLLAVTAAAAAPQAGAQESLRYRIISLGTLGGDSSKAEDVNLRGQVVGGSDTADGHWHAFIWEKGVMEDLGVLGGRVSHAYAVNNLGQVAGHSHEENLHYHAFFWSGGEMTDLGAFGDDGFVRQSAAYDLNDEGVVVGYSESPTGQKAFRWRGAGLESLGETTREARAVSEEGVIVGRLDGPRCFRWKEGVLTELWVPPLAGSVELEGTAMDVNDGERIVGYLTLSIFIPPEFPSYIDRAVQWIGGVPLPLYPSEPYPSGESRALRVNNRGVVLTEHPTAQGPRYTLWRGGRWIPLEILIDPGETWRLEDVAAVNEAGLIAGTGYLNGRRLGYLMLPAPTDEEE